MTDVIADPSPNPGRTFRLRSLMLVIAGVAGVLAITPRAYLPIVAIFAVVATVAATVIRLTTGARWLTAYAWVTALYPLFAIGLVYICWFAAWYELGHVPRPSLDDPKDIDGLAAPAYLAAAIGLHALGAAFFTAVPLCLVRAYAWMTIRPRRHWAATVLMLAGITAWALAFVLSSIDPGGVLFWFFD